MTTIEEQVKRKHPLAKCEECPLYSKPCAPTDGPEDAEVVVVSRSPGYHEAQQGKPFSGPSGKVLEHLLEQNGVKRKDVKLTNTVLCAPDQGKVPPDAIKACADRVRGDLAGARLVIAAGSEAVNLILGRGSVDRYRGYRIEQDDGRIVVATNNPALVLRDDSTFPNLVKDFKRAFNPLPPPRLPQVEVISDRARAHDLVESLLAKPGTIAADIESVGGLTQFAEPICIQFAITGDSAYVVDHGVLYDDDFIETDLKRLLESDAHQFVWHNGKFDVKILRTSLGINARVDHDTLLLSYVCDERPGVHSLEYLLMEEFGWPNYEPEFVKAFKRMGRLPETTTDEQLRELHTYAGFDAAGTLQLYDLLTERAKEDDVYQVYVERLLPAIEATLQMELHGFVYDVQKAADILEQDVLPELEQVELEARRVAEMPLVSLRSPKQMSALYYKQWGVKHAMQARPDKRESTDESARLEILADRFTVPGDPLVKARTRATVKEFTKHYQRFKKLDKQASTYLFALIERAEQNNESRVYTDLLLHGTNSGRLSSRNPNLQNITRTKEGLPDIRGLFRASPGRRIVQADYSQAELRTIAALSGDTELSRIYTEALDLHDVAAERFYGSGFTKEQRSRAKNMNFGVAYRQSAATFQEKHDIPEKEGQKFIDWWWSNFRGVAKWEQEVETQIRSVGTLVSPFGRKRRFYLLTKENIQASYREGINFYPQSTASDFTLRSVVEITRSIDRARASLCITVHDSIVGDVEESYIDEYSTIVRQIMESRPKEELGWTLPFLADISIGNSWGEC